MGTDSGKDFNSFLSVEVNSFSSNSVSIASHVLSLPIEGRLKDEIWRNGCYEGFLIGIAMACYKASDLYGIDLDDNTDWSKLFYEEIVINLNLPENG